jgi:hypothetical protein
VREGLKRYSKWPTYPQLYVDGELVGAEVAGVAPPPQTPREKLRKAKSRGSG